MKKIKQLCIIMLLPFVGNAQTLFINGAILHLDAGSTVFVNGNFQNQTGSNLTNNGNLKVMGNVTNNQTMPLPGNGVVEFVGTTTQTINGSATYQAKDVLINNANGVVLNTPLLVDGSMSFTNGILTSSSITNSVQFTTNGTHSGASDSSHVIGYAVKAGTGSFTYPVGNSVKYEPIDLNLSANAAGMQVRYDSTDGGTGAFSASGTDPMPLVSVNHTEHWDLSPVSTATGTVTMHWNNYKGLVINNTADLRVGHYVGGNWQNEGGNSITGTAASGSLTSNALSTWSPFALGSMEIIAPLPVAELIFTAKKEASSDKLSWSTSEEKNSGYFNVQHSSNATDFETIGQVYSKAVNGNSTSKLDYEFTHNLTKQELQEGGNNYYRLQLVDIDEKLGKRSKTINLYREVSKNVVKIYPNPASSEITIETKLKNSGFFTIKCFNMQGQIVKEMQSNQTETKLEIKNLSVGMYMIQVIQKNQIIATHKIEKN